MPSRPELSCLVVAEADHSEAVRHLDDLVIGAAAQSALLIDRSGQLVARAGSLIGLDFETLSVMIAANFASAREIARLLGEQDFLVQFHQGSAAHVLTHQVSANWLLGILFERSSDLGLVKILAGRVSTDLADLHGRVQSRRWAEEPIGRTFAQSASSVLDSTFNDSSSRQQD